jgi:hypothetical protein
MAWAKPGAGNEDNFHEPNIIFLRKDSINSCPNSTRNDEEPEFGARYWRRLFGKTVTHLHIPKNPRLTTKNHTVELPGFLGEACFSASLIPRLAL